MTFFGRIYLLNNMRRTFLCSLLVLLATSAFAISPERTYKYTPSDYGLKYEQSTVQTDDGYGISVWHIPTRRARASVVVAYPDARNMAYWLSLAYYLNYLHYEVWLFDWRGFGESSDFETKKEMLFYDEYVSDLSSVLNIVESKNRKPIVLMGYSMGTIIINEYLNRVNDIRIKAAIYDGFVGDPYSYVSRLKAQGKNVILPEHYEYPGAYTGIPSLYISATQDKFCSKEEIPQEATEIKEFDCDHIMGLSSFKEEYISLLGSFLKNNL